MKTRIMALIVVVLLLRPNYAMSQDDGNSIRYCKSIEAIAWSPDGQSLAVQGAGGTAVYDRELNILRVFDEEEYINVRNLNSDKSLDVYTLCWGKGVAWHPNGHTIATPYLEVGNMWTKLWDVQTREVLTELPAPQYRFDTSAVTFSPTQGLLAITQRTQIISDERFWDVSIWNVDEIGVAESPLISGWGYDNLEPLVSLSWNSDALLAVAGAEGSLWILSVTDQVTEIFNRKYDFQISDIAWHPTDNVIAATSPDSNIYLINVQSGDIVSTLEGNGSAIKALDWEPSGEYLATGNSDGRLYIWNVTSNKQISILEGHEGAIVDVDWNPDGQLIATASLDDTVRLWEANLDIN
jgi:WD40 repeat protein